MGPAWLAGTVRDSTAVSVLHVLMHKPHPLEVAGLL
jgi:hypothetical protein